MLNKEWMDVLTVAGILTMPLVTLWGFRYLSRQMQADREALETQTSWQIYSVSSGILQTFMNHPECRPFFYDNLPTPSDEPMRSKVLTATELICDHLENLHLHRQSIDPATYDVWLPYARRLYENSPTMREFLREDREGYRYSAPFRHILDSTPAPNSRSAP